MTAFSYATVQRRADALHELAKDGALKLGGQTYTFTFDRREGVYVVTDPAGEIVVRFNTRKITVARKWLREYFEN